MKKVFVLILVLLFALNTFGFSLRMETLGRTNVAIPDFESDVERNPANLIFLEQPYFKLVPLYRTGEDKHDTRLDVPLMSAYISENTKLKSTLYDYGILGFYKFKNLYFGIKYNTYPLEQELEDGDHISIDPNYMIMIEGEGYDKKQSDYQFMLGYKFRDFGLGLTAGKYLLDQKYETLLYAENFAPPNPLLKIRLLTTYGTEEESMYYGGGVNYVTERYSMEVGFRIIQLEHEDLIEGIDSGGVPIPYDINNHDDFPINKSEITRNIINLKGTYNWRENFTLSLGIQSVSSDFQRDLRYSTYPDSKEQEITDSITDFILGIGYKKDRIILGFQMELNNYTYSSKFYEVLDPLAGTVYLEEADDWDFSYYSFKFGGEYGLTENINLRMGLTEFRYVSAERNLKDYLNTGTGEIDYEIKNNLENLIENSQFVFSCGLEYLFNNRISVEYGFSSGKYYSTPDNPASFRYLEDVIPFEEEADLVNLPLISFTTHALAFKYSF